MLRIMAYKPNMGIFVKIEGIILILGVLMRKNITKKAFTLAEVLITLGIIGIVAAMTIPTIINNYQHRAWVTMLKEDYAMISEGFRRMMATEGVDFFEQTEFYREILRNLDNNGTDEEDYDITVHYMGVYFKSLESIPYHIQVAEGWPAGNNVIYGEQCEKFAGKGSAWYVLNDNSGNNRCEGLRQHVFKMANGGLIRTALFPKTYPKVERTQRSTQLRHAVGELTIDVNGEKPPNKFGRDAFIFVIGQNGMLYPLYGVDMAAYLEGSGRDYDSYYWKLHESACSAKVNSRGKACAARVMEEGWQMNY